MSGLSGFFQRALEQNRGSAVDWLKIRSDDTIVVDSPNSILNECYVFGINWIARFYSSSYYGGFDIGRFWNLKYTQRF